MTMTVTVLYHYGAPGWWIDSPDIPGWTGGGDSLPEAFRLASEGARFALDTADLNIVHRLADDAPSPLAQA